MFKVVISAALFLASASASAKDSDTQWSNYGGITESQFLDSVDVVIDQYIFSMSGELDLVDGTIELSEIIAEAFFVNKLVTIRKKPSSQYDCRQIDFSLKDINSGSTFETYVHVAILAADSSLRLRQLSTTLTNSEGQKYSVRIINDCSDYDTESYPEQFVKTYKIKLGQL